MKSLIKVIFVILTCSSFAVGAEQVTMSGQFCDGSTKVQRTDGSVANSLTTSLTYWCPISFSGDIGNVESVSVVVKDNSSSGSISCALYSLSNDASEKNLVTKSTSASGTGVSTLTYTNLTIYSSGSLTLACTLPASATKVATDLKESEILNYKVTTY